MLSEQGEDAFQQQYGLFYVNRIYIGGYLQAIYNLEYRFAFKFAMFVHHLTLVDVTSVLHTCMLWM